MNLSKFVVLGSLDMLGEALLQLWQTETGVDSKSKIIRVK